MKIVRFTLISVFIVFGACSTITSNKKNEIVKPTNQLIDSQSVNRNIVNDSIAEIRRIGTEILNGLEIKKIDEKYIYYLIRSVMEKDSIDRIFYFKVFNKIRNQAVGNVVYEIRFYSKDFCQTYPNDLFCLNDSILKSYAYEIGEVISSEEAEPQKYVADYINWIKEKTNSQYTQKSELFFKYLLEEMDGNK